MPNSPSPSCPAIARLAFLREGQTILIRPPDSASNLQPPQVMSRIPASLISWLMFAADALYQDHRRYLAFLLLFSPRNLHWLADLPIQTCRTDGVAWSLSRQSLPSIEEGFFLAGTFQSHPAPAASIPIMPLMPGIHLVYHPSLPAGPERLQAAVGYDCPARSNLFNPEHLIAPEHDLYLHNFRSRFHLR